MHKSKIRKKRDRDFEEKLITSGGDDRFDVCMFRKGFHAFLFTHSENQALLYQVLHLYT